MDQIDESKQILFEQCWKEAHQGFTRMRKMVMRQVALSCPRQKCQILWFMVHSQAFHHRLDLQKYKNCTDKYIAFYTANEIIERQQECITAVIL